MVIKQAHIGQGSVNGGESHWSATMGISLVRLSKDGGVRGLP